MTNQHVVDGGQRFSLMTADGVEITGASVVAYDTVFDLAILRVPRSAVGDLIPLPLADIPPKPGARVIVVGSPLGLDQSVTDGIVSAIRESSDQELIQITAPISPGSSGSPVVDISGEVVGVATFKLTQGENLNFAVGIRDVKDLLQRHGFAYGAARAALSVGIPNSLAEPKPLVPDSEILSPSFFGTAKEINELESSDTGHVGDRVATQLNIANEAYDLCERIRKQIAHLYKNGQLNKQDSEASGLIVNINTLSTDYRSLTVDTNWNINAETQRLLSASQFVDDFRKRLDPFTVTRQTLLERLDEFQEAFRDVLRRYALFSKRLVRGYGDGTYKRAALVDIYYPYLKAGPAGYASSQERRDALDLLTDYDSLSDAISSAEMKGISTLCSEKLALSSEDESKLSDAELLALRRYCYSIITPSENVLNAITGVGYGKLDAYVQNKRDSALALVPSSRPDIKEAVAWWLYHALTHSERTTWAKYCRYVDSIMTEVDRALQRRKISRE